MVRLVGLVEIVAIAAMKVLLLWKAIVHPLRIAEALADITSVPGLIPLSISPGRLHHLVHSLLILVPSWWALTILIKDCLVHLIEKIVLAILSVGLIRLLKSILSLIARVPEL